MIPQQRATLAAAYLLRFTSYGRERAKRLTAVPIRIALAALAR